MLLMQNTCDTFIIYKNPPLLPLKAKMKSLGIRMTLLTVGGANRMAHQAVVPINPLA